MSPPGELAVLDVAEAEQFNAMFSKATKAAAGAAGTAVTVRLGEETGRG